MSFKSDFIGVLKEEIGPSAPVFFKKCMLQLGKDQNVITQEDLEEIADWVYDEIRTMIDDKTAFRVRHQIIRIPPNARELKRVAFPPAEPGPQHVQSGVEPMATPGSVVDEELSVYETPAPAGPLHTETSPGGEAAGDTASQIPAVPAAAPERMAGAGSQQGISDLFSKMTPDPLRKTRPEETPSSPQVVMQVPPPVPTPLFSPVQERQESFPSGETAGTLEAESLFSDPHEEPEYADDPVQDLMEKADNGHEESGYPETIREPAESPQDRVEYTLARLETDGQNPDLWWELSALYARSGKFKDAADACQKMLEYGGETAAIWHTLGDFYKKTGQYEDSDSAYARSLELESNDPVVWLKRAKVLTNRNKLDDALACCDQSLALDNSSAETWHYKAFVLTKAKRLEEALEIYTYLKQADMADEKAARQASTIQKMLAH